MKTPINDYCGFTNAMLEALSDGYRCKDWPMTQEEFARQAFKEAKHWFKEYIKECRMHDKEDEDESF